MRARNLEPRAYTNAPIDLNFLLVGYQNSSGALLFDPAIEITDASAEVNLAFLGYVHTLDVAGNSAKIGILLPYASLAVEGKVNDDFREGEKHGLADPSLFFSVNLYGAPALSLNEFKAYQQDTIVGVTFKVSPPLGVYDADELINIGTNRWTFEPGLGISKALGSWIVEGSAAATFYTDNNAFDGGNTRQQDPIYSIQLHLTYNFPRNIWLAVSSTYYNGGRTTIADKSNADLQQNWRTGLTLALPVDRLNSIKLFASRGVSTRTGNNYDALGIAWQYRWGGGF